MLDYAHHPAARWPHLNRDLAASRSRRASTFAFGGGSANSIADMGQEYRVKFPGKAVITGLFESGDIQLP
jgi:hypothetical protein